MNRPRLAAFAVRPPHGSGRGVRQLIASMLLVAACGWASGQGLTQNTDNLSANTAQGQPTNNGAIRLREPAAEAAQDKSSTTDKLRKSRKSRDRDGEPFEPVELPRLSEFETYVNKLAFPPDTQRADFTLIRRLGADLMTDGRKDEPVVDYSPLVPPDYLISAGDEIVLSVWGSVDAELRLVVDRSGRITVPRAGTILLSGVRYADVAALISQRLSQVFKNFQVSVSLGQLRGVRVYVTGFVERPGAYTVNSLSSIANALVRAGGPVGVGELPQHPAQARTGRGLDAGLLRPAAQGGP